MPPAVVVAADGMLVEPSTERLCPPVRSRAHSTSTNIRPTLSLCLNRNKSSTDLAQSPSPSPSPSPSQPQLDPPSSSSMLLISISRLLDLFHFQSKYDPSWSPTPSTNTNDFSLPVSASHRGSSSQNTFSEKQSPKSYSQPRPPSVCHNFPRLSI